MQIVTNKTANVEACT